MIYLLQHQQHKWVFVKELQLKNTYGLSFKKIYDTFGQRSYVEHIISTSKTIFFQVQYKYDSLHAEIEIKQTCHLWEGR